MLNYDMTGKLIKPSRLIKTVGGDIDGLNGIPSNIEIPTTGDFSGVAVSDFTGDVSFAKTLSRASAGKMVVRSSATLTKGRHKALKVNSKIIGGGSSATGGNTRKDFRVGFRHQNENDGLFLEYLSPDSPNEGTYITAVKDGVTTRKPITYKVNNPTERYDINFWCSRIPAGGWEVTIMEGKSVQNVVTFDEAEVDLENLWIEGFVEWNWTYASGFCEVSVAHFSRDLCWQF